MVLVNLLIYPPGERDSRIAAGAVILVIYGILIVLMITSYIRVLWHAIFDPGFVGQHSGGQSESEGTWQRSGPWQTPRMIRPSPPLESFYDQDFFVCDTQGRPIWCPECQIWKPDRARHFKEFGRCIRRFDHYCPWVGGIVAERNFKFFIQFCTYAALFSLLSLLVAGYFLGLKVEYRWARTVHLSVTAGLAVFFMLLAGGTALSTWLLAAMNLTTLDNIHQKTNVWQVAVSTEVSKQSEGCAFPTVTAPKDRDRVFAILRSPAGCNPFDAVLMENLRQVLGRHWWHWLLPLRNSPLCYSDVGNPDKPRPSFACIEEIKEAAGLGSMTPQMRSDCDRLRRRQRRFPQLLAGAGAPLKTVKVGCAGG